MAGGKSLDQLYKLYKSATEKVLSILFRPNIGLDKTCREIERRVKRLKSRKRKFDSEFFSTLRQAIYYRQRASDRYDDVRSSSLPRTDADVGHDYFIELLIWIDQELTPFEVDAKVEEGAASVQTLFEHLTIEEPEKDKVDKIVGELKQVYASDDRTAIRNAASIPLLDEKLTKTLRLLHDLRAILDHVRGICEDVHNGALDNVTGSLLMSVAYKEVNAMCSYTALLTDNWNEVKNWTRYEVFEEFGLHDYFKQFQLMVSLSPVLLLILDQTSQTERSKDETGTASATVICQQLTSDAGWKVAMESMRHTFAPAASLESSFTCLIHLSPLTDVIRRLREARRAHSKSYAPLVENPIAADLFDFLESRKPIAAISALFGLGMLLRYDRRSAIYSSLCVKDYAYQLYVWEKHQERERNVRPESQKSTQMISEYDDLLVNCDNWTLGLRHAQLIGDCQRWTIARSLIQPEQPCPMLELLFIHEVFHVLAANDNTIKSHPVSTFVLRLKEVHGYRVTGTSLNEIVQSHKQWHHSNHKLCMQRLQKQLSDP